MKKTILSLIFLAFMSTPVLAADSSSGCGLGWAIFKKNSLVSSSLRATTNAIFLNTVAMTFGTSGCAQHSIVKNEKKSIHYTESNYDQLVADMSRGQGEYVSGLAGIIGCDQGVLGQTLQQNLGSVLPSHQNPSELIQNVQLQVLTQEPLAKACGII